MGLSVSDQRVISGAERSAFVNIFGGGKLGGVRSGT
jgi:hypothetical protein